MNCKVVTNEALDVSLMSGRKRLGEAIGNIGRGERRQEGHGEVINWYIQKNGIKPKMPISSQSEEGLMPINPESCQFVVAHDMVATVDDFWGSGLQGYWSSVCQADDR